MYVAFDSLRQIGIVLLNTISPKAEKDAENNCAILLMQKLNIKSEKRK